MKRMTGWTAEGVRAGEDPKFTRGEVGCEMTWGNWSVTARVQAAPFGDVLGYQIVLDFCGHQDGMGDGLYGSLSTGSLGADLDRARDEAMRLGFFFHSSHCEDADRDTEEYARHIDLAPLLDMAIAEFREAMMGEMLGTAKNAEG